MSGFFKDCQDLFKTPKSHFVRIFVPRHIIWLIIHNCGLWTPYHDPDQMERKYSLSHRIVSKRTYPLKPQIKPNTIVQSDYCLNQPFSLSTPFEILCSPWCMDDVICLYIQIEFFAHTFNCFCFCSDLFHFIDTISHAIWQYISENFITSKQASILITTFRSPGNIITSSQAFLSGFFSFFGTTCNTISTTYYLS